MSVSNLLPRIQNIFAKIPKNKEFICDASLAPALPHITTIFIDAKTHSSPEEVLGSILKYKYHPLVRVCMPPSPHPSLLFTKKTKRPFDDFPTFPASKP
jgi:hypothetical protein